MKNFKELFTEALITEKIKAKDLTALIKLFKQNGLILKPKFGTNDVYTTRGDVKEVEKIMNGTDFEYEISQPESDKGLVNIKLIDKN